MSTPHLHQHHDHSAPNHHAHHDAFRGLRGLVAALSMVGGRQSDADLSMRLGELQPDDRVVDAGEHLIVSGTTEVLDRLTHAVR